MVGEESAPYWEPFRVEQLGGCRARIGKWLGYVWSPSLLLGQPLLLRDLLAQLLLARLLKPECQALQRECRFYGFETRTQLTCLSLGHDPPQ